MRTSQELFSLAGKTALVTGGSRGLGLQMAEALGEQGARIVLSARKQAELDEAVAHLKARGIDASRHRRRPVGRQRRSSPWSTKR